jgi:hypothetical protein
VWSLSGSWKDFHDAVILSMSRTRSQVGYGYSQIADQLAMTLGLCEAAADLIRILRKNAGDLRTCEAALLDVTRRACIFKYSDSITTELEYCIDDYFKLSLLIQSGREQSSLLLYQMAALGWCAKVALYGQRGDIPSANAAGVNCMMAIQQVCVLTGHSVEDLAEVMEVVRR